MLVGRRRELERLEAALGACADGRGAMLAVCGEAGIGKTRLADELADRAARRHGLHVVWGRAWETPGAPPYWPWIECVGALAERLGGAVELAPAVRALVSSEARASRAEGLRADPDRERFELFEGVVAFLRAAARETPLLVVLDDLHAADLASLELLAPLGSSTRRGRLLSQSGGYVNFLDAALTREGVHASYPPDDVDVAADAVGAEADVLRGVEAPELPTEEALDQRIEIAFSHGATRS